MISTLTRTNSCIASARVDSAVRGIRVRYEELNIQQRAVISEDGSTLTINAASRSIARYLGERRDGWPGQDGLHFRTMLAEVVTLAISRYVIQNRRQRDRSDSYRIFFEHMHLMEKWLPRVHAVLVPTNELRSQRSRRHQSVELLALPHHDVDQPCPELAEGSSRAGSPPNAQTLTSHYRLP